MSPVPEEERFGAYLYRDECPGSIAHPPNGDASFLLAYPAPFPPLLQGYRIFLPYRWPDALRIREVALYIVYIELKHWRRSALDLITQPRGILQQQSAALVDIADRLIAPRPWVEDMAQRFGTSHGALKQAAQSLTIPPQSIRTVLSARDSQLADAVHRQIKEITGYPWFLPADLRDRYPNDRW